VHRNNGGGSEWGSPCRSMSAGERGQLPMRSLDCANSSSLGFVSAPPPLYTTGSQFRVHSHPPPRGQGLTDNAEPRHV
jgi:hypothetical protein